MKSSTGALRRNQKNTRFGWKSDAVALQHNNQRSITCRLVHNLTMQINFYKPQDTVTGAAYSPWFKMLATLVTIALAGYGISFALRYSLMDYGWGVQLMFVAAMLMLFASYYGFLHSVVTIDATGIRQTWLWNRQVVWSEIRSAKLIGIPLAGWLAPPRLVVRTGNSFTTFNGGTPALLAEFARISVAFQLKP